MASQHTPRFEVNDIVYYQGQLAIITEKTEILNFNTYTVFNLDNSKHYQASSYELTLAQTDLLGVLCEEDLVFESREIKEITIPNDPPCVDVKHKPCSPVKARFASVDEDDLVALQKKRTSANTDKSTRWSVKIFKGCYVFLIKIII